MVDTFLYFVEKVNENKTSHSKKYAFALSKFVTGYSIRKSLNSVGMRKNMTLQNFTKWKLGNFTEFSWKEVQRKG